MKMTRVERRRRIVAFALLGISLFTAACTLAFVHLFHQAAPFASLCFASAAATGLVIARRFLPENTSKLVVFAVALGLIKSFVVYAPRPLMSAGLAVIPFASVCVVRSYLATPILSVILYLGMRAILFR